MASLTDRLKAAASIISGTAPTFRGDSSGTEAGTGPFAPMTGEVAVSIVNSMTAGDLYATQPHLRTVVSFVARNAAQLGRHVYTKTSDGRKRVESGTAVDVLDRPNEYMTGYDLFNMLFTELALYDMAIWLPSIRNGRWVIDPIPGAWVLGINKSTAFQMESYKVKYPDQSQPTIVPASDVVVFRGYSPTGFERGSSAVKALRDTLAEQVSAMDFRQQMWKRGGRVGMFMTRPKDAPEWTREAKTKFIQAWRASYSGDGANAGSTPLLEDGMELKRVGFTAKEEQWLEAATLALSTTAGAFHVPPAMVGVSGYNSFASVKEFRKMLYTETMGPSIAQVEATINTFLFPMLAVPRGQYLELNIAEKLQGDFEEQAEQLFKAVGGPYMVPNEARRKVNLPDVEGGDVLLAPLNMGASGNNGPAAAEPNGTDAPGASDSPPPANEQGKTRKSSDGAHADGRSAPGIKSPVQVDSAKLDKLRGQLTSYFSRQQKAVEANLETKDPEWWNQKQWNKELKALLTPILLQLSAGAAEELAGAKGLNFEDYSEAQTVNFLLAVAESRADLINAGTRDALKALIESAPDGEVLPAVKNYFEETNADRAGQITQTTATFIAGFTANEVATQLMGDGATKTWVSSGKPDSRHRAMNGETVPIGEKFSNGADWPGDPVLGAGQVANCACGVDIND